MAKCDCWNYVQYACNQQHNCQEIHQMYTSQSHIWSALLPCSGKGLGYVMTSCWLFSLGNPRLALGTLSASGNVYHYDSVTLNRMWAESTHWALKTIPTPVQNSDASRHVISHKKMFSKTGFFICKLSFAGFSLSLYSIDAVPTRFCAPPKRMNHRLYKMVWTVYGEHMDEPTHRTAVHSSSAR